MGKIIIILGSTGSGKSTSIKNLDPKSTVIINCIKNKDLPFKGSRKMYNAESSNIIELNDWSEVKNFIHYIDNERPEVTTLVIDDMRYIMETEFFKRAREKGYDKFTEMGLHFQSVLDAGTEARPSLRIVAMLHDDDIVSDRTIIGKKAKLVGTMVEQHYNPLELVDTLLIAKVDYDKENKPIYNFYTHRSINNGIEYPAKSPDGMFKEDIIPNDLNLVLQKMEEFYN